MLRPLPVLEPSRVVSVTPANQGAFGANAEISYPDYRDFRDKNRTFEGFIASNFAPFGFSPDATARPKVIYGTDVLNFFRSPPAVLGRGFRTGRPGPGTGCSGRAGP